MKLFYSHSKRQKPLVRDISQCLGKRFKSWIDEDDINIADDLDITIGTAINDDVDLFLLILCRDAGNSDYVKKEVEWALRAGSGNLDSVISGISA